MNVTRLVVKLRTKLFIQAPAKVNILEMEGFNLTVMTCMGFGGSNQENNGAPLQDELCISLWSEDGAKRNICISFENIWKRKPSLITEEKIICSIFFKRRLTDFKAG